ncbi:MAG: helix-turn-helix domain-containing protein [Frankiaceae bacterium]|jgi:ribosome-binding protein aMBF1 (putative translation factor)|nr:helix-turn-helix domain-containing protein [Frankiaceae bacterium]
MTAQPAFVGPDRAAEKIARARAIPGIAEESAAIQARMAEEDTRYAQGLAEIRRAASLTQTDLAAQMGVPQTAVSRIERRSDMLLSTLTSYLQAAGEHPRIIVTIDGRDIALDLAALAKQ